jgi:chromosome segregation ATPase
MRVFTSILLSTASLALVACASNDSGDSFADRVGAIEETWRDGQEDVKKGQEMVEEGNDKLASNRKRRQRELRGAEEGEERMQTLRLQIAQAAAGTEGTSRIEEMSDKLNDLRKDVEEHREEAEDAEDDIRDAQKKISRGESLIARGEAAKREAEARYRADTGRPLGETFGDDN